MPHGRYVYEITSSTLRGFQLRELWHYRHLAWLLGWRNVRVRYKQTVLGLGWAVLAPVAYTLIFVLLFRLVPVKAMGDLPYVPAAFTGMILWQFFSRALADAGSSLTSNANLITKVYFPRVVLPISATLSSLVDLGVAFILLAVVLAWYGIVPSVNILAAPLFVLLTVLVVLGCSLWLSAADGLFRDVRHAVPLVLQLGMFASPVAYTTTSPLVPERWRWLYELNPMVACLEGFRWAMLPGAVPPGTAMLAKAAVVTLLLLAGGLVFFARVERTVVDRV
jgi:lipopolysaccharide transport system permease protein